MKVVNNRTVPTVDDLAVFGQADWVYSLVDMMTELANTLGATEDADALALSPSTGTAMAIAGTPTTAIAITGTNTTGISIASDCTTQLSLSATCAAVGDKAINASVTCSTTDGSTSFEPVKVETTMTGAGQVGGRVRFNLVTNVLLGGWANAMKASVDCSTSGGSTGLLSCGCLEMTLPAGNGRGSYTLLELEGTCPASGYNGGQYGSFIYVNTSGTTRTAIDTSWVFMHIDSGVTAGAGKLLSTDSHSLKVALGALQATTRYLVLSAAPDCISFSYTADITEAVALTVATSKTVTTGMSMSGAGTWTTGILLDATAITTGISITAGSMTDAIKISGTTPVDGIEISSACSGNGINVSGACADGIEIGGACTAAALHISGDQVIAILYDVTAAATDAFKIAVPTGVALTDGIEIACTSTGTVANGINMTGTGTFTSGITLAGSAMTTAITISAGTMTDAIKISGTTPVDGIEISSACSANAINLSGSNATGIKIGTCTTAAIDIDTTVIAIDAACTAIGATGRVAKLVGACANGNLGDGYGMVECDMTVTGTLAGAVSPLSSWVNMISVTTGGNFVCAQSNGLYSEAGGVLTNGVFVFGMRAQCLLQTNGGAGGATFYPFSIVNNTNVTTALILCNDATSDLGETASACDAETMIPLFQDNEGIRYVKVYTHS